MGKSSGFDNVRIYAAYALGEVSLLYEQLFSQASPNLGYLQSVRQAIVKDAALRRRYYLRNPCKPAQSRRVEEAIAITLRRTAPINGVIVTRRWTSVTTVATLNRHNQELMATRGVGVVAAWLASFTLLSYS